ncbi:M12 family metallopeptidase [Fibrella sp. HMF5335]|uniref:M12 family metallopeptidase n=1 Tax=Fibrella rubiginis TaxID=2817060 RepID=A0A939GBT5_9BACT|nr:M12 family metallopeptidase [Fibrella rubiginis]MBO0936019.1 M12 family metallopeptidase [Fibrella rubiginis]
MKRYALLLPGVIGTLCLLSCSTDSTDAARPVPAQVEQAFPNQTGTLKTGIHRGDPVSYQLINGKAVFQGDIILSPNELTDPEHATTGAGRTLKSLRWTNKIVYYTIDPALPNQQRVVDAMNHWVANTGIRFVQRTNQYSYVTFQNGSGCSGYVGRVGGQQWITMGTECTVGNVIHEIGHTVGLYHEHSRADRDQYLTVNMANAQPGHDIDFQTYTQMNKDGFDQAGGLDFNSIMLYNSWAFSANGQPTITKKDGSTFNAQRNGLSPLDIATVQTMYP